MYRNNLRENSTFAALRQIMDERVIVIDGAMGTSVQKYKLVEADYRGALYADHSVDLKGNNDLLVVTRPDVIEEIHNNFLESGADIIETNTFNGTFISQGDYNLDTYEDVFRINKAAAELAKKCTTAWTQNDPSRPRFAAGAIGPTNKTLSVSPSVENPAFRGCTWDEVVKAYYEQCEGLMAGGVDLFLVETIFDTLNAKAALFAIDKFFAAKGVKIPVFVSGTIVDNSGRTLSGQTNEAFWNSLAHNKPLAIGLNCALGASDMRPYVENLSRCADCYVFCYPNAGLPNAMGGYDQKGDEFADEIKPFFEEGLLNGIGGCCGTSFEHIKAVAELASRASITACRLSCASPALSRSTTSPACPICAAASCTSRSAATWQAQSFLSSCHHGLPQNWCQRSHTAPFDGTVPNLPTKFLHCPEEYLHCPLASPIKLIVSYTAFFPSSIPALPPFFTETTCSAPFGW